MRAGLILQAQTPDRRATVLAALAEAARPHVGAAGFAMPNRARCFAARKA